MQFLKTLFWVLVAVIVVLFATRNWADVTLSLWNDIQLDIKLPLLLAFMFLIGFLPVFLVQRARIWSLQRRLDVHQRQPVVAPEPVRPEERTE